MNPDSLNLLLPAVLLGLSLLITSIGFYNQTYFVSVGYAFAIVTLSLAALAFFSANWSVFSLLHLALLVAWGLRLGIYLLRRERKPGYQAEKARIQTQYRTAPLGLRFAIWITVSILYVLMFLPGLVHVARPIDVSLPALIWQGLGLLVALGGLVIEGLADQQKAAAKAKNPTRFCSSGLYAVVRCPNYLGEILFWTGSWIMGLPFFLSPLAWIGALIGEACIVLIMIGSARRLEGTQLKRYGELAEYQEYIRRVPVLFPFLPIYSLKNTRIRLG